ncbi:MAG TPA: organic hydroperoxide resistance protein, partial [Roseiarcus sp.]|nr:organic hydroperoxide resistance protein [Roseiarcus sp.]
MVDAIKPLYTAHGTAIGGRNGHTRSDDGIVNLDLSVPKEMGGPGKPNTGTPEHLFSAGYAACFGGALDFIAKQ